MRVLLGSGGFRTDERVATLAAALKSHFGDVARILFVPYALADHDAYVRMLADRGLDGGYAIEGIHRAEDPVRAVEQAEAVYVGGGNTFRLLHTLQRLRLIEPIQQRVRAGMPYFGVSAGSNVACPTIMTTNDMPIIMPESFDALGLVPFQINAHYFLGQTHVQADDGYVPHFGETRDDRIREFHELNEQPVIGLWEGGLLRVEPGRIHLSAARARIFRVGEPPVDVQPGACLDPSLRPCPPLPN